jgi:hypothetical protein
MLLIVSTPKRQKPLYTLAVCFYPMLCSSTDKHITLCSNKWLNTANRTTKLWQWGDWQLYFLTSRWCRQTIMKITDTQGTKFFKMLLPSSSPVQNCFIQLILINNHLLLHELPFQRCFKVNLVWVREGKNGRDIFASIGHLMECIMHSEQMGNSTPLELSSG